MDADGLEFGLGAGNRTFDTQQKKYIEGKVSDTDTAELGSGTKAFTCTAVLRLVDQGKVKLDDPAHIHIDGPLKAQYNITMMELLGTYANNVTVGHLIAMESGIADYEIGDFDRWLLQYNNSHKV